MKPQSEGKRLGKLVLYCFIFVLLNLLIILNYDLIQNKKLNIDHWITILGFVLTSLAIVWGAKASSNFAKRIKKGEVDYANK